MELKIENNDIIYGDRSSHYDENMAHLITDYTNFATQIKSLVDEAISKVNDEKKKQELQEKFKNILETKTIRQR